MNTSKFRAAYKVIKDKKLVVEAFNGVMTLDCYKAYKLKQSQDVEFDPTYSLFVDMQDVVLDGTVDQVKAYVDFVISNGCIVGERKNATVINTANQHVYAILFSKLHENDNLPQEFRIFTDFKTAFDWLENDIAFEELMSIIESMRDNENFICSEKRKY